MCARFGRVLIRQIQTHLGFAVLAMVVFSSYATPEGHPECPRTRKYPKRAWGDLLDPLGAWRRADAPLRPTKPQAEPVGLFARPIVVPFAWPPTCRRRAARDR